MTPISRRQRVHPRPAEIGDRQVRGDQHGQKQRGEEKGRAQFQRVVGFELPFDLARFASGMRVQSQPAPTPAPARMANGSPGSA